MKAFRVSTSIHAAPEIVWRILTDAPAYPSWNTTVDRVDGRIAPGETVTVHAKISPGRAFPVKVTGFVPPSSMKWSSAMPLGLFKGERTFTIAAGADGTCQFTMSEAFTGFLAPLITRSIPDLQPAFDEFAAALKRAAESAR